MVQTGAGEYFGDAAPVIGGVTSAFSADVSSGISDDFITVGVDYKIQGSKTDSSATLRSKIPAIETLYQIADTAITESGVAARYVDLNTGALSYSIDEDLNSRAISIKASFNNDFTYGAFAGQASFSGAYYDYSVDANTDNLTKISTVAVNGSIKAQVDGIQNKIDRVSGMYYNYICEQTQAVTGYLHSIAQMAYADMGFATGPYSLNPGPESISVSNNYVKGEINLSATFSDKDFIAGFKTSSFSVSVKPALVQYRAKASANKDGLYQVFALGTRTREEVTINGNLSAYSENSDYRTEARNFIDNLRKFYIPKNTFVTNESVDETPAPFNTVGFSHGYNYAVDVKKEFIPSTMYDKTFVK